MLLEATGISKRYGQTQALADVSLRIEPGQVHALLGRNGAGKSTLASIVAGLRKPDRGAVRIGDVDVLRDAQRARRHLGLATQELALYPLLSVRTNVRFFGRLAGVPRRTLAQRVPDLASALDLGDLLDRKVGLLSGGEQRRVHVAAALVARPAVVLLDEPTAGSDVQTRAAVVSLVRQLAAAGSAVCYSTHYLAEAEAIADSVTVLDEGRVLASGSLQALIAQYGASALELSFAGKVPPLNVGTLRVTGSAVSVQTDDPTATLKMVVERLGDQVSQLSSIKLVDPSLESVYLTLTRERNTSDPDDP